MWSVSCLAAFTLPEFSGTHLYKLEGPWSILFFLILLIGLLKSQEHGLKEDGIILVNKDYNDEHDSGEP